MIALKSADYRRADESVHITHVPLNMTPNTTARGLTRNIGTADKCEQLKKRSAELCFWIWNTFGQNIVGGMNEDMQIFAEGADLRQGRCGDQ